MGPQTGASGPEGGVASVFTAGLQVRSGLCRGAGKVLARRTGPPLLLELVARGDKGGATCRLWLLCAEGGS